MDRFKLPGYGLRLDGTPKGEGYFGPQTNNLGQTVTELSMTVGFDGKEHLIPLVNPFLGPTGLRDLLRGDEPTDAMYKSAISHAKFRMMTGRSVWAEPGEKWPAFLGSAPGKTWRPKY
jgi:hypothetical protein